MGIKAKQVAGVTTLVVLIVVALSAYHVATLVRVDFQETASRGQMLAQAIFQRAKEVVAQGGADPYEALRTDGGIRSMIESGSANWLNVTYVAIVNKDGVAVAHNSTSLEGQPLAPQEDFARVANGGPWDRLKAVYSDRTFEISLPMLDELDKSFGEIRIGVSTTLVRIEVRKAVRDTAGAI
ncbi:MAG: hypothetical protein JF613_00495, partial [Acidobacteria bacterium]|nr:hypothetical protein [Acidobacteriota bacterium]